MPKVYFKSVSGFPAKEGCSLCLRDTVDEYVLGPIYKISSITLHYYCLLMASKVEQNGADHQGLLGFFTRDIKRELKRGASQGCCYCRKMGATVECSYPRCHKVFHLPCGISNGSLHRFYADFKSYCGQHRPRQKVPSSVRNEAKACDLCASLIDKNTLSYIWPTCCKPPSSLFHRMCLQKMACSAGYYFKCPLCNNKETFIEAMKKNGIYVPEQEASWEREPNAYGELLERNNKCEAEECKCSKGRSFNKPNSEWEVEACSLCGGSGVHLGCSEKWRRGQGYTLDWYCVTCQPFANTSPANENRTATINFEANIRAGDLGEEVCVINDGRGLHRSIVIEDSEDEIIDVETADNDVCTIRVEAESVVGGSARRKRGRGGRRCNRRKRHRPSFVEGSQSEGDARKLSSGSSTLTPSASWGGVSRGDTYLLEKCHNLESSAMEGGGSVEAKGESRGRTIVDGMLDCLALRKRLASERGEELKEMLKQMGGDEGVSSPCPEEAVSSFWKEEEFPLRRLSPNSILDILKRRKGLRLAQTQEALVTLLGPQPKVLISDCLQEKNIREKYLEVVPTALMDTPLLDKENSPSPAGRRRSRSSGLVSRVTRAKSTLQSSLIGNGAESQVKEDPISKAVTPTTSRDFDMTLKLSFEEQDYGLQTVKDDKEILNPSKCNSVKRRSSKDVVPATPPQFDVIANETENLDSCKHVDLDDTGISGDIATLNIEPFPVLKDVLFKPSITTNELASEEESMVLAINFEEPLTHSKSISVSANEIDSTSTRCSLDKASSNDCSTKDCRSIISVNEVDSTTTESVGDEDTSNTVRGATNCQSSMIDSTSSELPMVFQIEVSKEDLGGMRKIDNCKGEGLKTERGSGVERASKGGRKLQKEPRTSLEIQRSNWLEKRRPKGPARKKFAKSLPPNHKMSILPYLIRTKGERKEGDRFLGGALCKYSPGMSEPSQDEKWGGRGPGRTASGSALMAIAHRFQHRPYMERNYPTLAKMEDGMRTRIRAWMTNLIADNRKQVLFCGDCEGLCRLLECELGAWVEREVLVERRASAVDWANLLGSAYSPSEASQAVVLVVVAAPRALSSLPALPRLLASTPALRYVLTTASHSPEYDPALVDEYNRIMAQVSSSPNSSLLDLNSLFTP